MHLDRCREADRRADQTFDPRPEGQMLALDFLRVPFARAMLVGVQMPGPPHPASTRRTASGSGKTSDPSALAGAG